MANLSMHVRSGPGRGIWASGCIHLFLNAQACCIPPAHVWDRRSTADLLGKCIRPIPRPHQTPRQYPIGMAKRGMEGGAQRIPITPRWPFRKLDTTSAADNSGFFWQRS
ncbi:hypothetical protein V2G26_013629 [Clonostachys chloroleuca]